MTDYKELVKALQWCAKPIPCSKTECPRKNTDEDCACHVLQDAAAAIEELQAQLPKRGEIVRCGECIHFTQGGWCDREFDWFPVDENDFCSMAEKMEVRDGD